MKFRYQWGNQAYIYIFIYIYVTLEVTEAILEVTGFPPLPSSATTTCHCCWRGYGCQLCRRGLVEWGWQPGPCWIDCGNMWESIGLYNLKIRYPQILKKCTLDVPIFCNFLFSIFSPWFGLVRGCNMAKSLVQLLAEKAKGFFKTALESYSSWAFALFVNSSQ